MGVSFSFDAFVCLDTRKQQLLTVYLDLESKEPRQLQYNIRNDITKSTLSQMLDFLKSPFLWKSSGAENIRASEAVKDSKSMIFPIPTVNRRNYSSLRSDCLY